MQGGQDGVTISTMEAICFKKKLLANNKSIKNEVIKNNIFILGEDDISLLPKFINSEYVEIGDNFI